MTYHFGNRPQMSLEAKGQVEENGTKVYSKALCGELISENAVPACTAKAESKPFIILEDPKTAKRIGLNKYHLARGLLLLGKAGAGKTNIGQELAAAILHTMEEGSILFINDTKGDYFEEHVHHISADMVCVIGSGHAYREITKYWNIFAEIMPRGKDGKLVYTIDSDVDALEISSQLFDGMKSETQPIFPSMARQILAAMLIYFMRKYWRTDQSKLNNKEFLKFMLKLTAEDMKAILEETGMEDHRSKVNYIYGGKSGNQSQGVLSYVNGILSEVFIGPFAESDPAREFSVREIFEGKKKVVIFLEYDLMRGETLAPVYTILIDQLLKYALGGRSEKRKDVYLMIDEWAVLKNRLKHMSNTLSFGRSQGVKLICGLQNVSAVEAIYGEAESKNIMAGFQNVIGFNVTDQPSCQFLAERSGRNYVNYSFTAQNNNLNTQREGYCLEEWDIQRLECGEAAVMLADEEPFLFHFPEYKGWK